MKAYSKIIRYLNSLLTYTEDYLMWSTFFTKHFRQDNSKHLLNVLQLFHFSCNKSDEINSNDFLKKLKYYEDQFTKQMENLDYYSFIEVEDLNIKDKSSELGKPKFSKENLSYFIEHSVLLELKSFEFSDLGEIHGPIEQLVSELIIHFYLLHQEIVEIIFWVRIVNCVEMRARQSLSFNTESFMNYRPIGPNPSKKFFTSETSFDLFYEFINKPDFKKHKGVSFIFSKMKSEGLVFPHVKAPAFATYVEELIGLELSQLKLNENLNYELEEKEYANLKESFSSLLDDNFYLDIVDAWENNTSPLNRKE